MSTSIQITNQVLWISKAVWGPELGIRSTFFLELDENAWKGGELGT